MTDLINKAKDTAEQAKLKLAEAKGRVEQKAEDMKSENKTDYHTDQEDNTNTIAGP